jgi:hypothetical protein
MLAVAHSLRGALMLAALGLLAAGPGRAGEAAKPAEKRPPLPLQGHVKNMLPMYMARCPAAALVRVVSAGELQPDENPPAQDQQEMQFLRWGGGPAGQVLRARCEVVELLRGAAGLKELVVLQRHFDTNAAQQQLWQEAQKAKRQPNFTQEDLLKAAALAEGESYLLFLIPDETATPAKGEKGPFFSTAMFPIGAPGAELLAEMRKMAKRIREYQQPPELSAEQAAAAERLLAELAATDYGVRTKANDALAAMGPAVRKLLEAAVKSTKDLETRERCRLLLEDIKPIPGGSPEDWAGTLIIKKPPEKPEGQEDEGGGKKPPAAVR